MGRLGVRFETEVFAPLTRPVVASRARPNGKRAGDGYEVAQAVIDWLASIDLDTAQNVGVVTRDEVRAGADRRVRNLALVIGDTGRADGRCPCETPP